MKIGLDFGTTNSVVSYWDEKSQELRVFSYNNSTYTPSSVAWDTISNKVYGIGVEARNKWDNNPTRYNLLQTFKTLLSHDDRSFWELKGWNSNKTPEDITKLFIDWLLISSSKSFSRNKGEISNLVVSVPEFWQKEAVNAGAESLQRIIKELKLPLQQLVSEPLAAVAYYIWKSKLKKGEEKKILVFDVGGGTFDVSWCKATKDTIEVLGFEGNDSDLAGMFHLREIIRNGLVRQNRTLDERGAEFKKLVWRLENYICGDEEQADLKKRFKLFQKDPESYDTDVEAMNDLPVFSGDIFKAYGKVHEGIQEVINGLDRKVDNIASFDQILLVGGFSQYFLVRKTILDYFKIEDIDENENENENEKIDERIKTVSKQESYLAIAYGAALLAADQVKIIEKFPHSVYYNTRYLNNENITLEIIESGQSISGTERFFAKKTVRVVNKDFTLTGVIHLNGLSGNSVSINKKISLEKFEFKDSELFKIGIEINKSNISTFVLEDEKGNIHRCSMGELFDETQMVIS